MPATLADAVTPPDAVTVLTGAADGALDALYPYLEAQPWWLMVVGAFAVIRIAQPVLWALSQRTKTKWDDRLVKALAWLVGAVERRK